MNFSTHLKQQIFSINEYNFEKTVLKAFEYQAQHNVIYSEFLKYLKVAPEKVHCISQIPFLPIAFYKNHTILSANPNIETVFESSGTSAKKSRHFVSDLSFYRELSSAIFQLFYGDLKNYHILALLPSYLERSNSSLVYMVRALIRASEQTEKFYKYDYQRLIDDLKPLQDDTKKVVLIGVTFALLELAQQNLDLKNTIIIETGGMKGRGREQIRQELHSFLYRKLNPSTIHSEYGMTELLSHTYARDGYYFKTLPWFRILLRDIYDPFNYVQQRGAINIIDLANIDTCCFIQTDDIGGFKNVDNKDFEVLGRLDNQEARGCNLL